MAEEGGLFLGLDLSTQSVTAVYIDPAQGNRAVHTDSVNFDSELPHFKTQNGMHIRAGGEVTSPLLMWLEALDLLFSRQPPELNAKVVAVSGSGQQHGTVYWHTKGEAVLNQLKPEISLAENLKGCFTIEDCPIWADSSTKVRSLIWV